MINCACEAVLDNGSSRGPFVTTVQGVCLPVGKREADHPGAQGEQAFHGEGDAECTAGAGARLAHPARGGGVGEY